MTKKIFIFYLLILLCYNSWGQQNNNWYFGRKAGLSFNPVLGQQIPVVLSNSVMLSDEASASISDENGMLLFYTNGTTVFNKQHQIMLNGDNLDGYISATQVLIIPMPGSDHLYYIFTTGALETSFASGYKYSIVDMNQDNGNGEVVTKNMLLWSSCTERLTAARHANGIDVWVITNDNNSNIFRSWLVTCTGIEPAIVSTVGVIMNQHATVNSGVMKVSPDGRSLVQTHFPALDEIVYIPNFFQLFNFNSLNGTITNPRTIGYTDVQYTHCDFSPDSRLLYITRPSDRKIDQIDISQPSLALILASRYVIDAGNNYYDIQLAVDEKIYISKPSFEISTISNPNVRGFGCNFQKENITLMPGTSFLGLPTHINDIISWSDPNNGFNYTILDSCSGTIQFNAYTILPNTISWLWDFGDGVTSTLQNPLHTFSPTDLQYPVKLKISSSSICGTIFKFKNIIPQGVVTSTTNFNFKNVCDSNYIRFTNTSGNLNETGIQFEWDFGDGNTSTAANPNHFYTTAGSYIVQLKMLTGTPCLNDSISKTIDYATFSVTASPDVTIKVGESVVLSYSGLSGTSEWTPNIWLNNYLSKSPVSKPLEDIQYKIVVTDTAGCKAEDFVFIKVLQYDDIYVPKGFTPNNDGLNDVLKPFYPGTIILKEFSLFDRWGNKIYSTSSRGAGWDGKINGVAQATGVYVWTFSGMDEKSLKAITKKGTVTLIK